MTTLSACRWAPNRMDEPDFPLGPTLWPQVTNRFACGRERGGRGSAGKTGRQIEGALHLSHEPLNPNS